MKLGLFTMPQHPPERSLGDGFEWDLQVLKWADQYGFAEAWVGEHHTCVWEPNPAPDLLIAQAFRETKQIRLGPGGFCLPFHHPVELAHRGIMLDHISKGRLNFGIAASSIPTDWPMFDVDGAAGQHRDMTREALEIILKVWTATEPFEYVGKFWKVRRPEPLLGGRFGPHLKPYQTPHPPIAVSGLSPGSETLKLAGRRGFIPLSLNLNTAYVRSHWDAISAGAAAGGRVADRNEWRLSREILVADTDEEARRHAVDGMLGRFQRDYSLPVRKEFKLLDSFKHSPDVPDSDLTLEYFMEHNWLVGSPQTVARKVAEIHQRVGGFGYLLMNGYDYSDRPEAWRRSMELLAKDVLPRLSALTC
jgi:alkanesulfonate monooxygenase SsuD/methylene tetrahydromethanopterin reductase-like flavin-dependent oxidoreductase (luciferase family)